MDTSLTIQKPTDEVSELTNMDNKEKHVGVGGIGIDVEKEDSGHKDDRGECSSTSSGAANNECSNSDVINAGEMIPTNTTTLKDGDGGSVSDFNSLCVNKVTKKTNMYNASEQPLNNPWTFWVDRTRHGVAVEEFECNLKKICTVYTVHRFWSSWYNIPLPSTLGIRSSLHLTRDERKPIWETPYNCKGGTFRLKINKKDTDKAWRELAMALVGETLVDYVSKKDDVCGISVSIKEGEDMLLIWNANAEEANNATILDCVHVLLPDIKFIHCYKAHQTHEAFNKHNDARAPSARTPSARAPGRAGASTKYD